MIIICHIKYIFCFLNHAKYVLSFFVNHAIYEADDEVSNYVFLGRGDNPPTLLAPRSSFSADTSLTLQYQKLLYKNFPF